MLHLTRRDSDNRFAHTIGGTRIGDAHELLPCKGSKLTPGVAGTHGPGKGEVGGEVGDISIEIEGAVRGPELVRPAAAVFDRNLSVLNIAALNHLYLQRRLQSQLRKRRHGDCETLRHPLNRAQLLLWHESRRAGRRCRNISTSKTTSAALVLRQQC